MVIKTNKTLGIPNDAENLIAMDGELHLQDCNVECRSHSNEQLFIFSRVLCAIFFVKLIVQFLLSAYW